MTRITAPADVLAAMGPRHSVHEWIAATYRAEPLYQAATRALLAGLDELDREDAAAVAAYEAAGAAAIADLEGLRAQVVAVAAPERTRFIVANETCLFRIGEADVHLLGADCPAAVAEVDAGGPYQWWGSPILASRAHDDDAPGAPDLPRRGGPGARGGSGLGGAARHGARREVHRPLLVQVGAELQDPPTDASASCWSSSAIERS